MTPYYVITRVFVKKNGIPSRKYLRRPQPPGDRWSWAESRVGAARFHDLQQAEAYAAAYPGADTMRVEQ